jgi:hypothetical protein
MTETVNETVIPIALFATVFGILYMFFTTRHKERLALIEKGADASLFTSERRTGERRTGMTALKLGMLAVGIGVGILLGSIINTTTLLPEEVAYFSMIFLCGGISLIIYYLVEKKVVKIDQ